MAAWEDIPVEFSIVELAKTESGLIGNGLFCDTPPVQDDHLLAEMNAREISSVVKSLKGGPLHHRILPSSRTGVIHQPRSTAAATGEAVAIVLRGWQLRG